MFSYTSKQLASTIGWSIFECVIRDPTPLNECKILNNTQLVTVLLVLFRDTELHR